MEENTQPATQSSEPIIAPVTSVAVNPQPETQTATAPVVPPVTPTVLSDKPADSAKPKYNIPMMIAFIIVILLAAAGLGYYYLNMQNIKLQTAKSTAVPAVARPTVIVSPTVDPAKKNTSDAQLNTDVNNINSGINGLNTDVTNVDQSITQAVNDNQP